MLDFVYYPVSAILWFWHKAFSFVIGLGDISKGADQGVTWALAVMFLVFTLRVLLFKPFVKQVRTTRQMQELQPQIKAIQKKYSKDRQRLALEMQKLQREHGFNPLMGCLPALVQMPVFIGLYHVLQSFNRTATGVGRLGLDPYTNATLGNYVFSAGDVQSFLKARLFGAPLSSYIRMDPKYADAFDGTKINTFARAHGLPLIDIPGSPPTVMTIALVAVPLMIISSLATHFNARLSVSRQSATAAANPQAAMMNKLMLWAFPLGVLVFGAFLPIAVLFYWVSNNIWTYGQQHIVFRKMDQEDEAKKLAALEKRNDLAPRPGAKPGKAAPAEIVDVDVVDEPTDAPSLKKVNRGGTRPGQLKNRKNPNRGRANQGPKRRP